MGSVHQLLHDKKREIPCPLYAQPDDKFVVVDLDTDSYVSMTKGAFAVIKVGKVANKQTHAIDTGSGLYLARLFFLAGAKVSVKSICLDFPSKVYEMEDVQIVGRVTDVYPTGLDGTRWVAYDKEALAANRNQYERPLLRASAS